MRKVYGINWITKAQHRKNDKIWERRTCSSALETDNNDDYDCMINH